MPEKLIGKIIKITNAENMPTNNQTNKGTVMLSRFYHCASNYIFSSALLIAFILCGCQGDKAFVRRGYYQYKNGQYDKAIQLFDAALSINSSNVNAYIKRGNSWAEKKDFSKALNDYNKAIEIDPTCADAYYVRAYLWSEKGNSSNALADYTESISLDPHDVSAYINRANLFIQIGETNRAIKDYTAIISMDPKKTKALTKRGDLLLSLGNINGAICDYSKVIQRTPNEPEAYMARANAWYQSNEYAKAINDLIKASELHSDDPAVYNGLAWLLSTCPDNKLRNGKRALEMAQKALEIVSLPGKQQYMSGVYSTLAAAYAESGNYEKAVQYQLKAIELLRRDGQTKNISELEKPLKLYREQKPLRKP